MSQPRIRAVKPLRRPQPTTWGASGGSNALCLHLDGIGEGVWMSLGRNVRLTESIRDVHIDNEGDVWFETELGGHRTDLVDAINLATQKVQP